MSAGGGGSEASARPDGVFSSHVSQAEGPLAGKRRRALVPAAGGGGLRVERMLALPGLQKDGNGGNVFPANLRFWHPLLASQLK